MSKCNMLISHWSCKDSRFIAWARTVQKVGGRKGVPIPSASFWRFPGSDCYFPNRLDNHWARNSPSLSANSPISGGLNTDPQRHPQLHWKRLSTRSPTRGDHHLLQPLDMPIIQVLPYDPSWPSHFAHISSQLSHYLDTASVPYTTIEHVGSTSIQGLAAKPNIDIIILVRDQSTAEKAREALIWQPSPTEYHKCIGDGGIRGRLSMKYQDWEAMPQRSVYIIAEDDEEGILSVRGYRDLRECLTKQENADLRKEYEECKLSMVAERIEDGVEYGQRKNRVIRKILKRAGWTDEEVDRKEGLDTRERSVGRDWPY